MTTYTNNNNVGTLSGSGASNSNDTLDNSTATNASLGGGNDELNVLNNSVITNRIAAGEGNDDITVDTNSTVGENSSGESMAMGGGADSVTLSDNAGVSGDINMSSGVDTFTMSGTSTVGGNVDMGSADDTLNITGGSVTGDVIGSLGTDSMAIENADITGNVYGDRGFAESSSGNDNISITDSIVGGEVNGDDGDDQITLSGSDLTGTVSGGNGSDNFTVSSMSSNIVIDGNEDSGDGDTDTLDLSALTGSIVYDVANPENGVFTEDGTGNTITFSNIENVSDPAPPVCFTSGMSIVTSQGEKLVDNLEIGDLVPTFDNGLQPIRYIYKRTMARNHLSTPIRFEPGTIGNDRVLIVSQKHCFYTATLPTNVLPDSARANRDHLIHADMLVNGSTIKYDLSHKTVTYFHIMFNKHELIECHGTWSESWHPIRRATKKDAAIRKELMSFFPEIIHNNPTNTPSVREIGTDFMKKPKASDFDFFFGRKR